jgi:hypothetical protein
LPLDLAAVTSLLRAAARLEPEKLVFVIPDVPTHGHIELPCFRRAASINLESRTSIPFRMPAGVDFEALGTLTIFSAYTVGLGDMISRCPRLRVLRLGVPDEQDLATIHSPSLQELFVVALGSTDRVDIVAPMLGRLFMKLCPYQPVNISVLAPMVKFIWWHCSYRDVKEAIGFGHWRLDELSLQPTLRRGELAALHIHASNVCNPLSSPGQFFIILITLNFMNDIFKLVF